MVQRVFTQVFVVAGAIIEKDSKILLVREAGKRVDTGKWNHPAGWVDPGEHPLNAVKREVREETGFDFTPTHILGIYSLVRKDAEHELGTTPHALKIIFLGTLSGKKRALHSDVSETRWFSLEEISTMDMATLRDLDIKQMAKDYFAGKRHSLELLRHTMSVR